MIFDLIVYKPYTYTDPSKFTFWSKSFAAAKRQVNNFCRDLKYIQKANLTNWTPPTKTLSPNGGSYYRCSMRKCKNRKEVLIVLNWQESGHHGV